MSTTYTPNAGFGLPATGDRNYGPVIGADISLLDGMNPVGALFVQTTEIPSSTLNVKVSSGNYEAQDGTIATYAGSTSFGLTASATNYVFLDLTASGALTKNTTGFPTTAHVRLATVVVGASAVTSISDARIAFAVLGSFLDGVNLHFGTVTGTQIGTSSSQKLSFFGATPIVRPSVPSATAGSSWTSTEESMLNAVYSAFRSLGLGG